MDKALKDVLAGIAFAVIGVAFVVGALSYRIGTPVSMGPGFLPLAYGVIMAGLGGLIIAKGFLAGEGGEIGPVPVRAIVLIIGAFFVFGLTVRGLGLVPSLFVSTLMAGFASHQIRPILPPLIAVGLTALSVLVFVVALQLRLPLLGPWLRF